MVGHGNLAEKAMLPVMPTTEVFPYTTRVFNEVGYDFGVLKRGSRGSWTGVGRSPSNLLWILRGFAGDARRRYEGFCRV